MSEVNSERDVQGAFKLAFGGASKVKPFRVLLEVGVGLELQRQNKEDRKRK
jgi:hypothetical protein